MALRIINPRYNLAKNGEVRISDVDKDLMIVEFDEIFPLMTAVWNDVVIKTTIDTSSYKNLVIDSNYFTSISESITANNGFRIGNSELHSGFFVIRNFTGKVLRLQLELNPSVRFDTFGFGIAAGNITEKGSIKWLNPNNDQEPINISNLISQIVPYKNGKVVSSVSRTAIENSIKKFIGFYDINQTIPKIFWRKYSYDATNWLGNNYISHFYGKTQYLIFNSNNTVRFASTTGESTSDILDLLASEQDENFVFYDYLIIYFTTKTGTVNSVPERIQPARHVSLKTCIPFIVPKNTSRQFYFSNLMTSNTTNGTKTIPMPQNKRFVGKQCVAYYSSQTRPTQTQWQRIYSKTFTNGLDCCAILFKNLIVNDDLNPISISPEFAIAVRLGADEVERLEQEEGLCEWVGTFPDILETENNVEIQPYFKFSCPRAPNNSFFVNLIDKILHSSLKDLIDSQVNENINIKEIRVYVNLRTLRKRTNNTYYAGVERLDFISLDNLLINDYSVVRQQAEPLYRRTVLDDVITSKVKNLTVSFGENATSSFSIPIEVVEDGVLYSNSPFSETPSKLGRLLKIGNECEIAVGNLATFKGVLSSISFSEQTIDVEAESYLSRLNKYIAEPYPTLIYKAGTTILTVLNDLMYLSGFSPNEFNFVSSLLPNDANHKLEQDISFKNTTFMEAIKSILEVIGYNLVLDVDGLVKLKRLAWFTPFSSIRLRAKPFVNNILKVDFSTSYENLRDLISVKFENGRLICSVNPLNIVDSVISMPSKIRSIAEFTGLYNPAVVGWSSKVYEKKLNEIEAPHAVQLLLGYLFSSLFNLSVEIDGFEPLKIGDFKAVVDPRTKISFVGCVSEISYSFNPKRTIVKLDTILTPVSVQDTTTIDFYIGGVY